MRPINTFNKTMLIICFILLNLEVNAQEKSTEYIYKGQHAVYYEYQGISGVPYSIHYDRIFIKNEIFYINSSIGVGFESRDSIKYLSIPFSINFTTGVKKHHFEIGLGATYRRFENNKPEVEIIKNELFYGLKTGYKFQAKNKIYCRVNLNMYDKKEKDDSFLNLSPLDFLLGLGIGYSF